MHRFLAILLKKNTLYNCVAEKYGEKIMSFNFGYSNYGMMGMNPMMGVMGMQQSSGGNVLREYKEKYGCDNCYKFGPSPSNYQMHVESLPTEVTHPSFWNKVKYYFFGG